MATKTVQDSSLTAIANAIRTKGGTSASLEFPDEFVSAIGTIGGFTENQIASESISGSIEITETTVQACAFFNNAGITAISCPNATKIMDAAFQKCTGVTSCSFPNVTQIYWKSYAGFGASGLAVIFPKLTTLSGTSGALDDYSSTNGGMFVRSGFSKIALPALTASIPNWAFAVCPNVTEVDLNTSGLGQNAFNGSSNLAVIVLRRTAGIVSLGNTNTFTGTPFASGGTGGTIYIPKSLYDALGTGTNDYKAASNWSTIDGYGTITWAKIEGSYYETHYADGTVIV